MINVRNFKANFLGHNGFYGKVEIWFNGNVNRLHGKDLFDFCGLKK